MERPEENIINRTVKQVVNLRQTAMTASTFLTISGFLQLVIPKLQCICFMSVINDLIIHCINLQKFITKLQSMVVVGF